MCVCLSLFQCGGPEDKDIYEEFLTQREIQNNINIVNGEKFELLSFRPNLFRIGAGAGAGAVGHFAFT